jgi:hypothetical protein
MWGLPLWLCMASPFIGFALAFFCITKVRTTRDSARAAGHTAREASEAAWVYEKGLFASAFVVLIGIFLMVGATGQSDENRVRNECAKHGMAPFREALGRNGCLNSKTHQKEYFEDVR